MRYTVKGGLYARLEAVQPLVHANNIAAVVAQSLAFGSHLVTFAEQDTEVLAILDGRTRTLAIDAPPPLPPCVPERGPFDQHHVSFSRDHWDEIECLTQRAGFAHPRDFLRGSIRNYLWGAATIARGGNVYTKNARGAVGRLSICGLFGE